MATPDLRGKTAVVTGASRGIGAALAEGFAARGMNLGLCSRADPALAASDSVLSERVDVSDEAAFEAFGQRVVDRFGAIDLWVNNAGVLEPIAPVRNTEVKDFRDHIAINLTGLFIGTRFYANHVRGRPGGGVLINVSSGAAWQPYAGWGAYCAGKAGVERLSEVVALEEADSGLRVHSIAPGIVDTAMQDQIRASSPEAFPELDRFVEMKRRDSFNTPRFVVENFLAVAFDARARPAEVAVRLPAEKG